MKWSRLSLLIISLFLSACQEEIGKQCESLKSCDEPALVTPETDPSPPQDRDTAGDEHEDHDHDNHTEPDRSIQFTSNVQFLNFKQTDRDKVNQALKELIYVIKSDKFKYEVLHHTYKGKETFVQNNEMTNAEIYQEILKGAEMLLPEADQEMDLELKLYYKNNSTIGYTYPSKLRIYMNTKYFNRYETEEVASNLMHEWLHKLGFKHDKKRTSRRKYSVPYAIGYLVEDLIIEMRKKGEL